MANRNQTRFNWIRVKVGKYSLLIVIITVISAILIGFGWNWNIWMVLLILGSYAGLLLISNIKFAISALLIVVYSFDYLSSVLKVIPHQVTWLVELAIGSIVINALFVVMGDSKRRNIRFILFLPVAIALLSALFNLESPLVALAGLRFHFKFLLMYWAIIVLQPDLRFMESIIYFLIGIAILQLPVAVFQFLAHGLSGDWVVGTFGASGGNVLSVFVSIIACILFSMGLITRRWVYFVLVIFLFLVPALSNSRGGFFLIITGIFTVYFFTIILRRSSLWLRSTLVLASLVILFVGPGISIWRSFSPKSYLENWLKSPFALIEGVSSYDANITLLQGGRGRIADFSVANSFINDNALQLTFGVGPGNASESFLGSSFSGEYYQKYPVLQDSFSGWPITILELGYSGLLAITIMFFILFYDSFHALPNIKDKFEQSITMAFLGIIVVYFFSGVYINAYSSDQSAFAFWLIAAVVSLIIAKNQRDSSLPNKFAIGMPEKPNRKQ